MRNFRQLATAILATAAFVSALAGIGGQVAPLAPSVANAAIAQPNPCSPPTEIGRSFEQTAWLLWIAATCPVNQSKYPFVVWENWIEQAQMYPLDPANGLIVPNAAPSSGVGGANPHPLHGSPLAFARNPTLGTGVPGSPSENCNKANKPPKSQPNLIICEEVRINGSAADYIAGVNLWNRGGQTQAAVNQDTIEFPPPAVEIKADWIDLETIGFNCASLPKSLTSTVHVESINGGCFALAGMHLISKLQKKWVWATFEPQNTKTNPNRCKVLSCADPFGQTPAVSHGEKTGLTPQLSAIMTAANLAPEWFNYRLDGVQSDFYRPQLLGNSIIEGENAGVPLWQASCITCHDVSSIKNDGTDGITLLTSNPVGSPAPLPSKAWIRRDFVWSLFEACPNSLGQKCAPASPAP